MQENPTSKPTFQNLRVTIWNYDARKAFLDQQPSTIAVTNLYCKDMWEFVMNAQVSLRCDMIVGSQEHEDVFQAKAIKSQRDALVKDGEWIATPTAPNPCDEIECCVTFISTTDRKQFFIVNMPIDAAKRLFDEDALDKDYDGLLDLEAKVTCPSITKSKSGQVGYLIGCKVIKDDGEEVDFLVDSRVTFSHRGIVAGEMDVRVSVPGET